MTKKIDVYKFYNALCTMYRLLHRRGFVHLETHGFKLQAFEHFLRMCIKYGWTSFVQKNTMYTQCYMTGVSHDTHTLAVVYIFSQDIKFNPVKYTKFMQFVQEHTAKLQSNGEHKIQQVDVTILCYTSCITNTMPILNDVSTHCKTDHGAHIRFQVLSMTKFLQINILAHANNQVFLATGKDIDRLCKQCGKSRQELCNMLPKLQPNGCIAVALNLQKNDIVCQVRTFDTGNSSIEYRVVHT